MAYKLAIADIVGVLVKGSTRDQDGNEQPFEFTLYCDRLTGAELQAVIASDITANAWFLEHTRGWRDQRLVLDDADQPAAFTRDALEVLFRIAGMSAACWGGYLKQVVATEKN